MEIAPEVPWIFLSHSGKQKEFTRRLYHELRHAGHHPFFDEDADTLPKGHHLPTCIVDACRRCKMGIVVLSHDYMESMWPMLELEQLAFHNPSILIYPLFYCLKPADLSNGDNLRRWQSQWDKKESEWPSKLLQSSSSHNPPFNIDMRSWPEAVRMLKLQTGEVKPSYMDDYAYIQKIVSNLCRTLPPPQRYLLGDHLKGMDRMQEDMDKLFQKQVIQVNGAIQLGVYGLGGSGKSTLCKTMANLYNRDFPGSSCWLEFPFDQGNDSNRLADAIKKVLPILAGTSDEALKRIYNITEAMSHLKEGLKKRKVFLAMDNVWDQDLQIAEQIVKMTYISGSRVMVTSRSKDLLQCLPVPKIVHVPSITKEEAVEALRYYMFPHVSHDLVDLRNLAESCFYKEQCHPLLLKAVGDKLKQVGRRMNTGKDWKKFILHLQVCRTHGDKLEESVLKVLETSFLALPAQLQKIFIDLVTCIPQRFDTSFWEQCEWLSMLHHGYSSETMRYELIELEYHGLLEIEKDAYFRETVRIHDLHKGVARKHLPKDAACNYLFEGNISVVEGRNWKYALGKEDETGRIEFASLFSDQLEDEAHDGTGDEIEGGTGMEMDTRSIELTSLFSHQLEILVLDESNVQELSVQGMGSLRFLRLEECLDLERIEGWKGAPNLASIRLRGCNSLREVGDIGCLRKLEELVITEGSEREFGLPELTGCHELKKLTFCKIESLECLASLGQPPKLQELDASGNCNLADVGALGTLTVLQKLDLHGCNKLQEFPDVNLSNLCILNLSSCMSLERISGSVCGLTSLEELHLGYCRMLKSIPDLKDLAQLRILRASSCCFSLEDLKLGISVLNSLQLLDLTQCSVGLGRSAIGQCSLEEILGLRALQTNISADIEPLGVFKNMLSLRLGFQSCAIVSLDGLDVSGLVSLEELFLYGFTSLQFITGLGGLHNLQQMWLFNCAPMEELSGLGDLTKLEDLQIRRGQDGPPITMASLPDLRQLTSLLELDLTGFSCLTTLPPLPSSLASMDLRNCTALTTLPPLPASLASINLRDCTALTNVSNLTCLTSLNYVDLIGCSSLRQLPEFLENSEERIFLDNSKRPIIRTRRTYFSAIARRANFSDAHARIW